MTQLTIVTTSGNANLPIGGFGDLLKNANLEIGVPPKPTNLEIGVPENLAGFYAWGFGPIASAAAFRAIKYGTGSLPKAFKTVPPAVKQ